MSKIEHLFNRIHFHSCTKWCSIRPHVTIHYSASFFTVMLPAALRIGEPCLLPPTARTVTPQSLWCSWKEKQDPWEAAAWAASLLCHCLSGPEQETECSSVSSWKNTWKHLIQYPAQSKCLINISYWQTLAPVKKELPPSLAGLNNGGLVSGSEFPITTSAHAVTW